MRELIANWLVRAAFIIRGEPNRIDHDDMGVDDAVIWDVELVRLERMNNNLFWLRLYTGKDKGHVFWLDSMSGDHHINVRHMYED